MFIEDKFHHRETEVTKEDFKMAESLVFSVSLW
jgi:hypothetical protein